MKRLQTMCAWLLLAALSGASSPAPANAQASAVRYGHETVQGLDIFYREAGTPGNPKLVLLHGFPASSHMYREVLAGLADTFHLIAPDYPGFGNSSFPHPDGFDYTFDHLAQITDTFLEQRGFNTYTLMIQDYGAPVGMRIALAHPERVTGIVSMNGNAYEEGLSAAGWGPIFDYWKAKTPELEAKITAQVFSLEGMQWQYTHGTRNPESILPDSWVLDHTRLARPGAHRMHLDLFFDYQHNVKAYPAWQAYLREHQPPVLAVWGQHDAFFPPAGAHAFRRDVPNAQIHLLNTGHFPLEEDATRIIALLRAFMHTPH